MKKIQAIINNRNHINKKLMASTEGVETQVGQISLEQEILAHREFAAIHR